MVLIDQIGALGGPVSRITQQMSSQNRLLTATWDTGIQNSESVLSPVECWYAEQSSPFSKRHCPDELEKQYLSHTTGYCHAR